MRHAFSFTDMSIIQTRHSEARRVASGRGGANGQLPHAASWTELHSGGLFGPDEGDLTAVLSQQADSRSAPSSPQRSDGSSGGMPSQQQQQQTQQQAGGGLTNVVTQASLTPPTDNDDDALMEELLMPGGEGGGGSSGDESTAASPSAVATLPDGSCPPPEGHALPTVWPTPTQADMMVEPPPPPMDIGDSTSHHQRKPQG